MSDGPAIAIMLGAVAVSAWCLVAVARDRWVGLSHLALIGALELALLGQAAVAVARLAGGQRPEEFATFAGYLVASVLLLPVAVTLAALERTRWGAVIAAAGCLVAAVVTLRLRQVWTPLA